MNRPDAPLRALPAAALLMAASLALLLAVGCESLTSDAGGLDTPAGLADGAGWDGAGSTDLTDPIGGDDVSHSAIDPADLPENQIAARDYLIVTTEAMRPAWERLADWRRQLGLPSAVVTMEEIEAAAATVDRARTLRDYLRAAHAEDGVQIVLLAGDTPQVPHRSVHVHTTVGAGDLSYETDGDAATDFYFSDLDGDWDGDGDGELAEFEDDLDMNPDVAVGRVPASDLASAEAYVDKVLDYERATADDYQDQVLFISEDTGWGDIDSSLMLDSWDGQIFHSDDFEVQKLYDNAEQYRDAEQSSRVAQIAALNDGRGVTVQLGHGSTGSFGYLDGDDVDELTGGPRYNVYLSCACYSGNFASERIQSGGERFVMNPSGGGVAYIGNTDVGMGIPSGALFLAEVLRRLIDLAPEDALPPPIGVAFADARLTFMAGGPGGTFQKDHSDRYTQFVVVLLGDPALRVWRSRPRELQLVTPEHLAPGRALIVKVRNSAGAAFPNAMVTLYRRGDLLLIATTDDSGEVQFDLPALPAGALQITASAPRRVPQEAIVTVD